MSKQITMSFLNDEMEEAGTRKKEFLEQIGRIIPWGELEGLVRPCYYEGKRGNKPYDLKLMIRIRLLQSLFGLSDVAARNELIDSRAFSAFCGIEFVGQVPDEKTIGRFRALLERNGLSEPFASLTENALAESGRAVRPGVFAYPSFTHLSPDAPKDAPKDPPADTAVPLP